jgi:peptidoglycan/xylan/chitin deacetylase (PgdA/CDA1 family)
MTMRRMLSPSRPIRLAAALVSIALGVSACQQAVPSGSPTAAESGAATAGATANPTIGPSPSPSASATAQASPTPTGETFLSYTVVSGDTLFHIAATYATSWQSLVFWNRDRYASLDPGDPSYDPGHLEIGWVLLVQPGVVLAYEPVPDATPRPSAGPTPAGAPSVAIGHGSRTSTLVALTFDMGGRVDPALDIMDLLLSRHVKATVFMTGAIIDSTNTDAGRQVLALIDGHRDEFELGNHSYTHRDFRTLSAAQIAVELADMERAVAARSTLSPRPLFRPPYGGYNAAVLTAVGAAGYSRTILWDIDAIDWKPEADGGPTTAQIVAKVRDNVRGGSIILFHLGGYNTLAALPGVLDVLAQKGLTPATVSAVIGS